MSTFEWKTIFSTSSAFSGNSRNAQHNNASTTFTSRSDDGSFPTVNKKRSLVYQLINFN